MSKCSHLLTRENLVLVFHHLFAHSTFLPFLSCVSLRCLVFTVTAAVLAVSPLDPLTFLGPIDGVGEGTQGVCVRSDLVAETYDIIWQLNVTSAGRLWPSANNRYGFANGQPNNELVLGSAPGEAIELLPSGTGAILSADKGDVNSDGLTDFVVNVGGSITAYINGGDESFTAAAVASAATTTRVIVGDASGDGYADILLVNEVANGAVTLYITNAPDTAWGSPVTVLDFNVGTTGTTPTGAAIVASGEILTDDGVPDIVISATGGGGDPASVMAGSASGATWSLDSNLGTSGETLTDVACIDFDNDGDTDCVFVSDSGNGVAYLAQTTSLGTTGFATFSAAAGPPNHPSGSDLFSGATTGSLRITALFDPSFPHRSCPDFFVTDGASVAYLYNNDDCDVSGALPIRRQDTAAVLGRADALTYTAGQSAVAFATSAGVTRREVDFIGNEDDHVFAVGASTTHAITIDIDDDFDLDTITQLADGTVNCYRNNEYLAPLIDFTPTDGSGRHEVSANLPLAAGTVNWKIDTSVGGLFNPATGAECCGDGILDTLVGETCDGEADCPDTCIAGICGNDIIEEGEDCEPNVPLSYTELPCNIDCTFPEEERPFEQYFDTLSVAVLYLGTLAILLAIVGGCYELEHHHEKHPHHEIENPTERRRRLQKQASEREVKE